MLDSIKEAVNDLCVENGVGEAEIQENPSKSVSTVANKFNVRVSDIRKWNPKVGSQKYVQPGDKVTLLVNVVGG